jgi:hypothetical protein
VSPRSDVAHFHGLRQRTASKRESLKGRKLPNHAELVLSMHREGCSDVVRRSEHFPGCVYAGAIGDNPVSAHYTSLRHYNPFRQHRPARHSLVNNPVVAADLVACGASVRPSRGGGGSRNSKSGAIKSFGTRRFPPGSSGLKRQLTP